MRKLVTIRKINDILPIHGADLIEVARIDDWSVVVKKGEFEKGEYCLYFEIDSFLPEGNLVWQMLVDKSSRIFDGKRGHRLKTIRLKGQISQGFAAKIQNFQEVVNFVSSSQSADLSSVNYDDFRDVDFSEIIGVVKYEPPVPAELSGKVSGNFPTYIPKTDQDRCQNIGIDIFGKYAESEYEVTLKLDGTSFTAFFMDGDHGVCSRNWRLTVDSSNTHNTLVRMYVDSGLQGALLGYGKNIAIQGELMGPAIQENKEKLSFHRLYVFDIYNIDAGCYMNPAQRYSAMTDLISLGINEDFVMHVPIVEKSATMRSLGISTVDGLLEYAIGPSLNQPVREGLVFKCVTDPMFSFKAISNKFLIKYDD